MNKESRELLRSWQDFGIDFGEDKAGTGEIYRGRHISRSPKWKLLAFIIIASMLSVNDAPTSTTKVEVPSQESIALPETVSTFDLDARDISRVTRSLVREVKPNARKPAISPVPPPLWVLPLPLNSYTISSCYAPRWGTFHYGIDMATNWGTQIFAVGNGKVIQSGWDYGGYGYSVTIDHGDGWLTIYGHASRVLVKVGQIVKAGSNIALVGSTGDSTGPHLHLGVSRYKFGANWTNPKPWLAARGVNIGGC